MPNEKGNHSSPRQRRTQVEHQEDSTWVRFYRQACDPDLAAELIQFLDSNQELKPRYAGLYLRCKQSIRRNKERQARIKRAAQFFRSLVHCFAGAIFTGLAWPVRWIRSACRTGCNFADACLPTTRQEPATARLKELRRRGRHLVDDQGPGKQDEADRGAKSA